MVLMKVGRNPVHLADMIYGWPLNERGREKGVQDKSLIKTVSRPLNTIRGHLHMTSAVSGEGV